MSIVVSNFSAVKIRRKMTCVLVIRKGSSPGAIEPKSRDLVGWTSVVWFWGGMEEGSETFRFKGNGLTMAIQNSGDDGSGVGWGGDNVWFLTNCLKMG